MVMKREHPQALDFTKCKLASGRNSSRQGSTRRAFLICYLGVHAGRRWVSRCGRFLPSNTHGSTAYIYILPHCHSPANQSIVLPDNYYYAYDSHIHQWVIAVDEVEG